MIERKEEHGWNLRNEAAENEMRNEAFWLKGCAKFCHCKYPPRFFVAVGLAFAARLYVVE